MNILITGGTGFIGQRLASVLLDRGMMNLDGKGEEMTELIVLADNADPVMWQPGLQNDPRVEVLTGDISDPVYVASLFEREVHVIFHLASIVSGHGEQDFDLAMKVNLDGMRILFEQARAQQNNARVVFTSSIAAFGGDGMPSVVGDMTKLSPTTTYGATKAIGELFINDYSRKGFFDGRAARLPTVIVRPGSPNKAASSFVSGLFREPIAGKPCVIPVDPSQPMPVLGYRSIVRGILKLAELDAGLLGTDRAVGLPAFNVSVQQLMESLKNAAGHLPLGEHIFQHDENIASICAGWPQAVDAERALALGLPMESSLEEIVEYYIEDYVSKTDG